MMKALTKVNIIILIPLVAIVSILACCGNSFTTATALNDNNLLNDKIGSYTTYYTSSPETRSHNIALAATKLNNTLVLPTQTISFNTIVGERSAERGFQAANIIIDGEFKEGIGGGVCQVSSTLYNAWVTSGLEIISAKAHSLPVTYIPMSRDATVSSSIDLTLKNNSSSPLLITTKCENKSLVVIIYGKSNGLEYNITTKLIRELTPAPPEIIYDAAYPQDHEEIIKKPRAGYITYANIETLKNGKVISVKKLREDTYQPIRAKILRGGVAPEPTLY